MRRALLHLFAASVALAPMPARAWLIYADDADRLIVEIEKAYGDTVPFTALPPPFDRAMQQAQGPETLSFRWRHDRRSQGMAFLRVDAEGRGALEFRFAAADMPQGRRLGAAAVLSSSDGTPLHAVYALTGEAEKADFSETVSVAVERPPGWWRKVDSVTFFQMSYHPLQKLDEAGARAAMRHAVRRVTGGRGTEQDG